MSNVELSYPRRILQEETKALESQLEKIADAQFAAATRQRLQACTLAAKILELYEEFQSAPVGVFAE